MWAIRTQPTQAFPPPLGSVGRSCLLVRTPPSHRHPRSSAGCVCLGGQMLQQKLTSASCVLTRSQPFPQFLGTPPPFPLLSLPDVAGLG